MGSIRKEKEPPQAVPDIPGYRLMRVLGQGGMSTVYLGQQLSLGRDVAIKVMRLDASHDEVGRRRFDNEARTVARLDHPNIVRIHDFGRTKQGQPYHVMPVFPRGHLGKRNLTHDETRVRQILEALLSALAYAHSRGVIHRDVKAENVLFDEAERPMLTDFGIALRRGYGARVTTAGMAVGSTAYMAPEQARGIEVDLRADLYSLGVLAWEVLSGSLPYQADDGLSMVLKHAQDPIPRLPAHLSHWQRFFDRALAKQPTDRFNDAMEMLDAMHRVPHAQRQPLRAAFARLRTQVHPRTIAIAAAGVAAIVFAISTLKRIDEDHTHRAVASAIAANERAPAADAGTSPAPGVDIASAAPAATEKMLRAAPESAAQTHITDAMRELQKNRLIAPAGDNAYDNVMAAWRTDPSHLQLSPVTNRLMVALSSETENRLRSGDDVAVRDLLSRMQRLTEQDRAKGMPVLAQTRKRLESVLATRMSAAETAFDRNGAQQVVASAKSLGIDKTLLASLQSRAGNIAQPGDHIADLAGDMTLVQASAGKLMAVSRTAVTRDEYAAFAKATQRKPALCRERASLLRVFAPRTWEAPGFDQSNGQAVVCVSWEDADAYARWMSQRNHGRYRLPTATEAAAAARSNGGKAVSEWLSECSGGNCTRRLAAGRSWRGAGGGRPLEAQRGYDDVGFRLVKEP